MLCIFSSQMLKVQSNFLPFYTKKNSKQIAKNVNERLNQDYIPIYVVAHAWYEPGEEHERFPVWSILTGDPTYITV